MPGKVGRGTRILTLLFLGFVLVSAAAAQEQLRLGLGTSSGSSYPPYMMIPQDGTNYYGLVFDILAAILKRTGDSVTPVYLPGPRLFAGVTQGQVDIDVFSNPQWRIEYNQDSMYTLPYLSTRMVLIYRKDLKDPPSSLAGLTGKRILVVNGFHYPGLDELFDSGKAKREVAPSTATVIKMLENNRGTIGVSDEAVFVDIVKREGYTAVTEGFAVSPPTEVSMRFPKRLAPVVERFNKAISGLRQSGELGQILAKYGLH